MRRKWILGIIGFLIVLSVVIFYIILMTHHFNKLKPQIARAVPEATGRELTFPFSPMAPDFSTSSATQTDAELRPDEPAGSEPNIIPHI